MDAPPDRRRKGGQQVAGECHLGLASPVMSNDDNNDNDAAPSSKSEALVIPAANSAAEQEATFETPASGTPEQLGFHLRFEGGTALLALENVAVADGMEIKRALFEVPDVEFPLDVTGGALKFQKSRLTLRAIELALKYERMLQAEQLAKHGLELLRERTRSGTIELLVQVEGAAEPVPVRAQGLFVPVGDAGIAVVLHEVVPFGPAPRSRTQLAEMILSALDLPGGHAPVGMIRRAEPFKTTLSRLLPAFGWKVPAVGDVRVEEVVLKKSDVTFRAWSGAIPDGWKKPKKLRRAPIKDAVALAVFADELAKCADDAERIGVVDKLIDVGAIPAAVVPFAAEVLRTDSRRRSEGNALVDNALRTHPDHLGVLSAHVDDESLDDTTLAARLATLGEAADLRDEAWVSARAYWAAARRYLDADEREQARVAAEAGFAADPTLAPVGRLLSTLLRQKDPARALQVGRASLERMTTPDDEETFATELAPLALAVEGAPAGRALLERALRKRDRADSLGALIELEIEQGQLSRAAELLARLLLLSEGDSTSKEARADVQLLAARLSRAQGDDEAARMHLASAQALLPSHVGIALQLAELHRDRGEGDAAIDVLVAHLDDDSCDPRALQLSAELRIQRAQKGDAEKALSALDRIADDDRSPRFTRTRAEALALVGQPQNLADLLREDANQASDPDDKAAAFARAAALMAAVGEIAECKDALLALLGTGSASAEGRAAEAILQAAAPGDVVAAIAEASEVTPSQRDAMADAMVQAERPADALQLIRNLDDDTHLLERARLASLSKNPAEEIAALEILVDGKTSQVAADAWARLGALHLGVAGAGPQAACDAYAQGHAHGDIDVEQWRDAAILAAETDRLTQVIAQTQVDLRPIPTDALRAAATALMEDARGLEGDAAGAASAAARRALGDLSARKEGESDVERYLAFAKETLEPRAAADLFAKAAETHLRPQWALDAAELEVDAGAEGAALARLLEAAEGPLGKDVSLAERAFEMACERKHLDGINRATALLTAHLDQEGDRAVVYGLAADALETVDKDAWEAMLIQRLDVDPGAEKALLALAPVWMERGASVEAIDRFERFVDVNTPSEVVVDALADVAVIAQETQETATEERARALLAAVRADDDERKPSDLIRLAILRRDHEDFRGAADALWERSKLGGDATDLRSAFVEIAELEHAALDQPKAAALALSHAVEVAPDDTEVSEQLLSLLTGLELHEEAAKELERRTRREKDASTKAALRLRLGDAFDAAKMPRRAEEVWLAALRVPPFQRAVFDRLAGRSGHAMAHRLEVRRLIAAARALGDDVRAAEYSAEAGAMLAGVLQKNLVGLLAYRHASRVGDNAQKTQALMAKLEIYRALNMADQALSAIARLLDRVDSKTRAQLLESRAEVIESSVGDAEAAAAARREALALDPSLRSSALKLERTLRAAGDYAEAIAVRRALADQNDDEAERAQTYAALAEDAIEHLDDHALAVELGEVALQGAPQLRRLRFMHIDALVHVGREAEACDQLGWLLENGSLDEKDRVSVARRKARLEETALNEPQSARKTLRRELAHSTTSDAIIRDLVILEEDMGEVAAAAEALRSILREKPDGTDLLGSRREILEWMGRLEEDAQDLAAAQETLSEAAALGRLSKGAALRWARLCEAAGDFDNAVAALTMLTSHTELPSEEYVAALGRLAVNAERAAQPARALEAWQARCDRIPNDLDGLRSVERLARELDEPDVARKASNSLLHQDAGDDVERSERLRAVAQDERERLSAPINAIPFLQKARTLSDSAALRQELFECAELASDAPAAFEALGAMWDAGDAMDAEQAIRRAELGLDVEQDHADVLAHILRAVEIASPDDARLQKATRAVGDVAPNVVARALLEKKDHQAVAALLRHGLESVETIESDILLALADAFPADAPLVRAAAVCDLGEASGGKAADRLLALADATGSETDLERAADALLAAGDFSALLGRLDALVETVAKTSKRRAEALTILRDSEAWEAVVTVLETSLAYATDDDRAIRMELVSVLRTGVEDDARAAKHLEVLVERDPHDREAWGELLEAYESLGDDDRLADALGRRVERATGLERRELVRRRVELLLEHSDPAKALSQLQETREEFPGDAALKDLERAIHALAGPEALAAFHATELQRQGAVEDAQALLALGPVVPMETRVLARAEVLRVDPSAAKAAAAALVEAPKEFARLASAIDDAPRERLFDAAIDQLVRAPDHGLDLVAEIRHAGVTEHPRLTVATVAWRLMAEGAGKARGDVQRIIDDQTRAAATIQLARRASAPDRMAGAMDAAGATDAQRTAFDAAMRLRQPDLETLNERARSALVASVDAEKAAIAALRLEDAAVVGAMLARLDAPARQRVALAAHALRLTEGRAPWMLDLARSLDEEPRQQSWRAIAAFASEVSSPTLAASALDALADEDALDADSAARRAEIAEAQDAPDAAQRLLFAATLADAVSDADAMFADGKSPLQMRRRAISRLVRQGDLDEVGPALDAFVGDGQTPEILTEAIQIARAARATDATDRLLQRQLEATPTGEQREAFVEALVSHRQHAMRQPERAFDVLRAQIDASDNPEHWRERAYHLAAYEGLVEPMLDVVDDALAHAGLLAALGRFDQALDEAAAIDHRCARILEADILQARGDGEELRIALEVMAEDAAYGPGPRQRLLDAARDRGSHDEMLRYALSLIESDGASARLVESVRESAHHASEDAATRAAQSLRSILSAGEIAADEELHLLDAWAECAMRTDRSDDVIDARLSIAQRRHRDADWMAWLQVALPARGAATVLEQRDALLSRPSLLSQAIESVDGIAAVMDLAVEDDPAATTDALLEVEGPSETVRGHLVTAAIAAERPAVAASTLVAGRSIADLAPDEREQVLSLYLDASAIDKVTHALLEVPLDAFDAPLADVLRETASRGEAGSLELYARLIASGLATEADFDAGIARAQMAPNAIAAAAFGMLVLRSHRRDLRALELLTKASDAPLLRLERGLRQDGASALAPDVVEAFSDDLAVALGQTQPNVAFSPPPPATAIERARRGSLEHRQRAWKELAEEAAQDGNAVVSARMLGRSGVSLADAPIEIRLVADSSLNDKVMRAQALGTAIAAATAQDAKDAERLASLVLQFRALDADGYSRAAERHAVRTSLKKWHAERPADQECPEGLALEADGWGHTVDAVDAGETVRWPEAMSALGRRPSAAARSTAAALAALSRADALATALQPSVYGAGPTAPRAIDFLARAGEARLRGRPLEALGLVRLEIGRAGTKDALEVQVRELARSFERFALESESYARQAAATDDADAKVSLLLDRSLVHETRLDDLRGALKIARFAAELAPGHQAAAQRWAELARASDNAQERVDALAMIEVMTPGASERVAYATERVQLLRDALGQVDAALVTAEAAEQELGNHFALRQEIARTYLAKEEPAKAGHALVSASDMATEEAQRLTLLREGAELLLRGDEVEAGIDALIVGARASDPLALDLLEERAREQKAHEALAEALRLRLANTEDGAARRVIAMELARHLADALLRRHEARQVLEHQAVEDERDFNARVVLAQWYLDERRTLDAALAYESAATVPDIEADARGPAAQNAAVLLSALGDLERAGPLAEAAIAAGAVNEQTLAVAIAFHRVHQNFEAIDGLLEQQLSLSDTALDASYIWMERSQIRAQNGDGEGSRQALMRVLENRPDHLEALDGLRVDAHGQKNFGTFRAALSRAADLGDDTERRVAWLIEIAQLDANELDDLRAAIATLDRAVELAPNDPAVLLAKADFVVRSGEIGGLPALLDQATALGATSIPGVLELRRGDAHLIEGERDAAMEAFRRATQSDAVAAQAWDRVLDLAEGLGDEAGYISALKAASEAASDDVDRAALLGRKEARLRAKSGDDDGAAWAWARILDLLPGDTEALRALREHYAKKRKLEQFAPLMERWATTPEAPEEKAKRLTELGVFLLDEVGAEAKAKAAFDQALAFEPREQGALIRLAQIGYAAQDWERTAELLDLVEPNRWPKGPIAFAFAQAECAAQRGASDADTRLDVVLRQDPNHIPALELVAKRAQADGRVDDAEQALEALAALVDASEDPVRVANICADLAQLRLENERPDEAKEAAERALELHPTSQRVLSLTADAREAAEDFAGAAKLLGSVAAVTEEGEERVAIVARRAGLLAKAEMIFEAAEIYTHLSETTDDESYKKQAVTLAMDLGDINLLERLGIDARPGDTNPGFHVLGQKAQSLLDEGSPTEALDVLEEAFREGQGDGELARVGLLAAEQSGTPEQLAFFLAQRLPHVTDPREKQDVALKAGRLYRDEIDQPEKAAEMLYVAHQCAPENLELRLELTSLYAQMPRLIAHAQTGVLQLIRRAPADARAFRVATDVAVAQSRADKKGAMVAAALLLDGKALTAEVSPPGPLLPEADVPLLQSPTTSVLAPKTFAKGRTFGTLVALLGSPLESEFVDNTVKLTTAERLLELRPDAGRYLERIDRLLPGRPMKFLVGDVESLTFHPGAVLHAILPRHVLNFGDAVLVAFVARAYAVARMGGVIPETLDPDDMGEVRRLLEAAFLNKAPDEATRRKAERLLTRVPEDLQGAAANGARVALPDQPSGEAQIFGEGVRVVADRFGLLVSGSLPGTLAAGALPEVLAASPSATAAALVASPRALDLCRFAARDDVWELRRKHRLIID